MQRDERLGRTTVDIPQLLIMLAKNRRGLGASRPGRGGGGVFSLATNARSSGSKTALQCFSKDCVAWII